MRFPYIPIMKYTLLLLILLLLSVCCDTAARKEPDSCPSSSAPSWNDVLKEAVLKYAGIFEDLLRSFALGFGAHMLLFLFWTNKSASLGDIRARIPISVVCGLATASFLFGASLFWTTNFC